MRNVGRPVLVISTEYMPQIVGGLGVVATRLAEHIAAQGTHVAAVCWGTPRQRRVAITRQHGVLVLRVPNRRPYVDRGQFNPAFGARLIGRWVGRPALIHVHSIQGWRLAGRLRARYHCPVVYTSHSVLESTDPLRSRLWQRNLYRLANRVICPSAWECRRLSSLYPWLRRKVVAISGGIDPIERPVRRPVRGYVLYVGRFSTSKGVSTLLLAFARVLRRARHARLHLVGSGGARYLAYLLRLRGRLKLGPAVIFHGFVPPARLNRYYARAALMVVPSFNESLGLVALEALNHQVPLLAANAGALRDWLPHEAALKVKPGRPRSLGKAMLYALAHSESMTARTRRGREVVAQFTWQQMAAQTLDLYRRLEGRR